MQATTAGAGQGGGTRSRNDQLGARGAAVDAQEAVNTACTSFHEAAIQEEAAPMSVHKFDHWDG